MVNNISTYDSHWHHHHHQNYPVEHKDINNHQYTSDILHGPSWNTLNPWPSGTLRPVTAGQSALGFWRVFPSRSCQLPGGPWDQCCNCATRKNRKAESQTHPTTSHIMIMKYARYARVVTWCNMWKPRKFMFQPRYFSCSSQFITTVFPRWQKILKGRGKRRWGDFKCTWHWSSAKSI